MQFDSYIQLWSDLCARHIPSFQFYRLNHNEMTDSLRNKATYPMLQLEEYDGSWKLTPSRTKFLDVQKCAIIVIDKIKPQNYNEEQQKMNNLKKWAAQFFAKIIEQNLLQVYCPHNPMTIDESSIDYFETEWLTEHTKGWRIEFTLICDAKEMNYDPTQWQS